VDVEANFLIQLFVNYSLIECHPLT
jgi:hypothetical protein